MGMRMQTIKTYVLNSNIPACVTASVTTQHNTTPLVWGIAEQVACSGKKVRYQGYVTYIIIL